MMGEQTKIEWADHTWNPWIGCQKVGPPCDNCYAEELMDTRYGRVEWGPHGERVRTSKANWDPDWPDGRDHSRGLKIGDFRRASEALSRRGRG
jgi:hypothetical protein